MEASRDSSGDYREPTWWDRLLRSGAGKAVRWVAVLGLLLGRWLAGWPGHASGWLPVLIISLFLLLPDTDAITAGPVRLEMRRTREEVGRLREDVAQLQLTMAASVAQSAAAAVGSISLATDSPETARAFAAALRPSAVTAASESTGIEAYDRGAV
jgi:hypothetical protein